MKVYESYIGDSESTETVKVRVHGITYYYTALMRSFCILYGRHIFMSAPQFIRLIEKKCAPRSSAEYGCCRCPSCSGNEEKRKKKGEEEEEEGGRSML